MKLQYYHRRLFDCNLSPKGGTTVAMEEIPVDMFAQITNENVLEAFLGTAKCSLKDNYNKKLGRRIATARLKSQELEVLAVSHWQKEDDRSVKEVVLKNQLGQIITLRHTSGNKSVHIVAFEE
jgi:hypothetical protein